MIRSACSTLRVVVFLSLILFVSGASMLLLAASVDGASGSIPALVTSLSLLLMLLGPCLLVVAAGLALLPGISRHLEACQR